MAVIAACVALAAVGVVLAVRWGGAPPETHVGIADRSHAGMRAAPAAARYIAVAIAAGLLAGVLAAGAGGRLVMRLLAATSPEAEGSLTDANEIVGRISADGTVGFIVFVGLPAGLLSGLLYALVRPVLPSGRAGGVSLGVLLLVLASTRIDPLRADNLDFDLVGPPWLAVLSFTVLCLFQGMLVAALAARMSGASPSPARSAGPRSAILVSGRILVLVVFLAALPSFLTSVTDILGSSG